MSDQKFEMFEGRVWDLEEGTVHLQESFTAKTLKDAERAIVVKMAQEHPTVDLSESKTRIRVVPFRV